MPDDTTRPDTRASAWDWPDFTPEDIACRHCGELVIDEYAMDCLQILREDWGRPVTITLAHCCEAHNRAIGGSPRSQHLDLAFDCVCPEEEQAAFVSHAVNAGFSGTIRYPEQGLVHLDCGPKRAWVWRGSSA